MTTPKICVSVIPRNLPEALILVQEAEEAHADFIEVRLDCLDVDSDLTVLAAERKTPLIATDHLARDEGERRAILLNAAKSGFQYVDAELSLPNLKSVVREIKVSGAKCIISSHDSSGCPAVSDLQATLNRELSEGADVCKIVVTSKRIEDNLALLQFTLDASAKTKIVCFAMGDLGKTSRLLSPVFGGFFTFAALERGRETAAGQMTLLEMRAAYQLLGLK